MNIPYNETPLFQAGDKIIEGVFKLGEDKEALIGMIEETLSVEQVFKLRELCFRSGSFNSLCLLSQPLEFCYLFADLLGIAAERYCFKNIFKTASFCIFHLLHLFRSGEIRRHELYQILRPFQAIFETLDPVLKGVPHGIRA